MPRAAGGELGRLDRPGQGIAQHDPAEGRVAVRIPLPEADIAQAECRAGALDQDIELGPILAEQHWQPHHALAADDPDFRAAAIRQVRQQGRPAAFGEIDGFDRLAMPVQRVMFDEFDGFEPGPERGEVLGRQGSQQTVDGHAHRCTGLAQGQFPIMPGTGVPADPTGTPGAIGCKQAMIICVGGDGMQQYAIVHSVPNTCGAEGHARCTGYSSGANSKPGNPSIRADRAAQDLTDAAMDDEVGDRRPARSPARLTMTSRRRCASPVPGSRPPDRPPAMSRAPGRDRPPAPPAAPAASAASGMAWPKLMVAVFTSPPQARQSGTSPSRSKTRAGFRAIPWRSRSPGSARRWCCHAARCACSRDAGGLVQAVDILGDDGGDLALAHQPRHRAVAAVGLGGAHQRVAGEAPPPGFAPAHGGGRQKSWKIDRLHLVPDAARAAEIGDAGFGADAGAREDDDGPVRSVFSVDLDHGRATHKTKGPGDVVLHGELPMRWHLP